MGRWISHKKISYTNGGIILHKWMWILFNVKGGYISNECSSYMARWIFA
jgi:hypothetical protein